MKLWLKNNNVDKLIFSSSGERFIPTKDLLKILWELVTADSVVDAYEENLYFKIAELLKIKRVTANQIKQQNSS